MEKISWTSPRRNLIKKEKWKRIVGPAPRRNLIKRRIIEKIIERGDIISNKKASMKEMVGPASEEI